mgnify:CR=1 FL=1
MNDRTHDTFLEIVKKNVHTCGVKEEDEFKTLIYSDYYRLLSGKGFCGIRL